MAEYMLSTDTSCDFTYEYVQQHQLPLVTLFYSIDDVMGSDGSPTPSRQASKIQKSFSVLFYPKG